jgi:subtilisin family serine protease
MSNPPPGAAFAPARRPRRSRRHHRRALALLLTIPGLVGLAVSSERAAAQPQEAAESYVVIMAADPVAAYEGDEPGLAATSPDPGERVAPEAPEVTAYVEHLEAEQEQVAAEAGVADAVGEQYTYALNGFEAELTPSEVVAIERKPEVAKVVPNELRQLDTDASPSFLGLDARQGAWSAGYTGEDVVVGVIDSGIWPEHDSFADDGSYSELTEYADVPCEFGDTAYNPDDAPFDCNDKLLGASDMRVAYKAFVGPETFRSARDYDGHGTHTASTAAGNADVAASIFGIDRGSVTGIAPRARVIAYSACGELGCFTSDLVGAIDAAVADGVDVINYSIGGGASLTDAADIAFLFAADANVWVATSNGNDGPNPETVGGPASVPWITSVGASTHDRTYTNAVRLGNGQVATGVSITGGTDGMKQLVDAADLGNELCDSATPFTGDVTDKVVLCLRGGNARVDKSLAVAQAGGAGMILYNTDDAMALVTDNHHVASIHVNLTTGLAVKQYIASTASATASLTAGKATKAQSSVMADFSSRGPNPVAPDLIKPDVTAPGVNILAGNTPFPTVGAPGQLFQSISGTSMSSPHVAGLFALLRQAHPDWSAAMAKSAVMTTARQDVVKEDGTTPADPFDMGAGHVDPSGKPSKKGSLFNPGLVYDAGLTDYFAFLCGADPSIFIDPASTCGSLEAAGVSTDTTDLNVASIGASSIAGSITVSRVVTSVADQRVNWKAHVEAPPGYSVTVAPDRVRLNPGESATVEVTITNETAPVDTWAFGALTWKGGGYEARSPIAAKAALFAAPDEVSGTGTDGSVEIPVQFGFEGAYTATAHGPAAAVAQSGTVSQDPDQTFDPADPTGTTAIPIDATDAAFLRLALGTENLQPPNPDIDIDLYLYDSAGNQVASSTAGGTAELIELYPADTSYTLYVHGWQTTGSDVAFDVQTWSVPATPGTGALVIDEAPTSVTIGQQAVVRASWSGLEPGQQYVGAVAHSDSNGLIGLTLVEIIT